MAALLLLPACGGGSGGGVSGTPSTAPPVSTSGAAATTSPVTVDISSRVEMFTVTDRNHVNGTVDYPQTPPVGGNHAAAWATCGYYSQPIVTESGVHSMEHGAVWITFRPSLAAAPRAILKALAKSNDHVLASPWANESLPAPVVASAWGLQLKAQSADDPAVTTFVRKYAAGPQAPEPGVTCLRGVGAPES